MQVSGTQKLGSFGPVASICRTRSKLPRSTAPSSVVTTSGNVPPFGIAPVVFRGPLGNLGSRNLDRLRPLYLRNIRGFQQAAQVSEYFVVHRRERPFLRREKVPPSFRNRSVTAGLEGCNETSLPALPRPIQRTVAPPMRIRVESRRTMCCHVDCGITCGPQHARWVKGAHSLRKPQPHRLQLFL